MHKHGKIDYIINYIKGCCIVQKFIEFGNLTQ